MALCRLGLLRGATDLLRLLGAANGGDRRECVDGLRRDPHLLRLADRHRLSLPSQTANQTVGGGRNSVGKLLRRSFWLFCAGRTWGRRDVACNVSLSIMVFLPRDYVIVGMEYGDVARYVSTCRGILFPAQ